MTYAKTVDFDVKLQQTAKFAKLLSHPARVAILLYLAEGKGCTSGDIAEELPLSRTTVSQHLQELKNAGLITGEADGLKINYSLNVDNIKANKSQLDGIFSDVVSIIE